MDLWAKCQASLFYPVPPSLAGTLATEQARDFSKLTIALTVLGLCALSGLYIEFFSRPGLLFRSALCTVIAGLYLCMVIYAQIWTHQPEGSRLPPAAFLVRMAWLFGMIAATFGSLDVHLMTVATIPQVALIYGVVVGCVATPLLVSPTTCALAYWVPFSIAGVGVLIAAPPRDLCTTFIFTGFLLVIGVSIVDANRRLTERTIGNLQDREKTSVISLLLKDFEENTSDWLWETGPDLTFRNVSPRLCNITGRTPVELTNLPVLNLFGISSATALPAGSPLALISAHITARQPFRDITVSVNIAGDLRFWSITGKPAFEASGAFAGYHGVGSDITEARRQQDQIQYLSQHDPLTGLPNRALFNARLAEACAAADTAPFALLYLDLDGFKAVNDSQGHAAGDAVLAGVAQRLRACLGPADLPARLGGDEFAVLRYGDIPGSALVALSQTLIESISQPYEVDYHVQIIGLSIGAARFPVHGRTAQTLLQSADAALYRAKAAGKGRVMTAGALQV
jgi:diguanylate cyclase (GGDEF)-like protein